MTTSKTKNAVTTIQIEDGHAQFLESDLVVIRQRDWTRTSQNVILSLGDLKALRDDASNAPLQRELEDATAHYMGDGHWVVQQLDEVSALPQSVGISCNDIECILAAA